MATRSVSRRQEDWRLWAAGICLLYGAASVLGLNRMLIGTEIWALYYAQQPLAAQMEAIRQDLVHPPLMYLLERAWIGLFGAGDRAVKLLPVVINIPALVLFVWLARRVTSRWREAAVLFAGHYLAVGSSPTLVRMYGLAILLALAALILWDSWRRQPTAGRLALWVLVATALVYTHYSGLLVIAGLLAANRAFGGRPALFTVASAIPAVCFLPWALYVYPVYAGRGLETNLWWVQMLLAEPYKGLALMAYEFLGAFPLEGRGRYAAVGAALVVHLALVVASASAVRRLWPPWGGRQGRERWFWSLLVLAGVPVAALFLFSVAATPALAPRFLLAILPAYWLLIVLLAEFSGRRGVRLLYAAFLPWVLTSVGWHAIQDLKTPPLRVRVEQIARRLEPQDLVLADPDLASHVYWELRHRMGREARVVASPPLSADGLSAIQRKALEQAQRLSVVRAIRPEQIGLDDVRRVWLLDKDAAPDADVAARITEAGFRSVEHTESQGPRLWLYVRAEGRAARG